MKAATPGMLSLGFSIVAGCAQFVTNDDERGQLQAVSAAAGESYVACVVDAADRYAGSNEDTVLVLEAARDACGTQREAFVTAETAFVTTNMIMTAPAVEKALQALDSRARVTVVERSLTRKAALGSAPAAGTGGGDYLSCMRAEGARYVDVDEPAAVIAEVAHSRCATRIGDTAQATAQERQGRALVMGLVLDRKAGSR